MVIPRYSISRMVWLYLQYVSEDVAESSYSNHEIWMNKVENLNDVSGTGRVILNEQERPVKPGDIIEMKAGCRHTIIADTELKVIEVQMGKDINVLDKIKNKKFTRQSS